VRFEKASCDSAATLKEIFLVEKNLLQSEFGRGHYA
jgi:hypothetical protein